MFIFKLAICLTFLFLVSGSVILPVLNTTDGFTASCTITDFAHVDNVVKSCTNILISNLKVPAEKSLNLHLKDGTTVTLRGTILFEVSHTNFWLINLSGNRISLIGEKGSIINAQGEKYWDGHGGSGGVKKPHVLSINPVNNALIKNIHIKNCPQFCTGISHATDLTIEDYVIDNSQGDKLAKNTDGIGISWSKNVKIENAIIHNQDQCVYVNQGSNMVFNKLHCIDSNGICATAGFAANNYEENTTKNITFKNSLLEGGLTGVQVIVMAGGGPGEVSDITFQNIELKGVRQQGIYVQMDFGNAGHPNNNIAVERLNLHNIHGTVEHNAKPVFITCGKKCSNWHWSDIKVTGGKNSCNYEPSGFHC